MGLFIPRQQLQDIQQHAAGQLLNGGPVDPQQHQRMLGRAIAASLLNNSQSNASGTIDMMGPDDYIV
jgi:hypothetical protein